MRSRVLRLVAVLFVGIAATTGLALASSAGSVGGPPSDPLEGPPHGQADTPDFVIGRGVLAGAEFELVAHGMPASADGRSGGRRYCVWVDYLDAEGATPLSCRGPGESLEGGAVAIESQSQLISPKRLRASEVGGSLSPRVASVSVTFQRHGTERVHAEVIVAQVSGDLRRRLRQPAPFGYFFARIRGRYPFDSVRVRAFNSKGRLIGFEDAG